MTAERTFTERELRRYTGEDGNPMYVAFEGVVYDVTDCPRWRLGMHERLHYPAQDLTSELPDAPHRADVFTRPCVKRVGHLISA
jgi:predicted heme/steroid binding protein